MKKMKDSCVSCEHYKSYYDELVSKNQEELPKDYGFCLIFYDEESDYRKDKGFGKDHICHLYEGVK